MRSSGRVAVQFITNCFRLRLSVRHFSIVLCLCVTISLYLVFTSYHSEDKNLKHIRINLKKFEPNGLGGNSRNLFELEGKESVPSDSLVWRSRPSLALRQTTDSPVKEHLQDSESQLQEVQTDNVLQRRDYAAAKSDGSNTVTMSVIPDLPPDSHDIRVDDHDSISRVPQLSKDNNLHHLLPVRAVLPRVLLIYDNFSVDSVKSLKLFLQAQRIDFDLFSSSKTRMPPPLSKLSTDTDEVIGRYALILCADVGFLFDRLSEVERQPFLSYSRAFNVSIVAVQRTVFDHMKSNTGTNFTIGKYIVRPVTRRFMNHVSVNDQRQWLFAKGGVIVTNLPWSARWLVFSNRPIRLQDVKNASRDNHLTLDYMQRKVHESSINNPNVLVSLKYATNDSLTNHISYHTSPLVLIDHDLSPGVVLVLMGMDIRFWLTKLVLLDVMKAYSSQGLLRFDNKRRVMVDIDDIFVAPPGLRMTADDVESLLDAQQKFQSLIPGFKFNLGFCGYYFDKGSEVEQLGNQRLVENANRFNWFGHIYNHFQPHNLTEEHLVEYMTLNLQFAVGHGIDAVGNSYSVSPHHSGVYPIYQSLYNAWKQVWNVTMTTTEEYPHLYPAHLRRGFIYQGVMVVPRRTCNLYTHTYTYDTFKGGREQLVADAEGGNVFSSLLYNPVNIFMTHVTNYAMDRLALDMFDRLFHFVQYWTNLKLITGPPLTLGKAYFDIFPEDRMPFWTSPCNDKHHLEIWPTGKNCSRLPSLLVIGPQKSGTTALYTFLKIHPNILSNRQTQDHYEEVQFFSNDTLYTRGIEWYMDQFPYAAQSQILFEKSATYLNHLVAPQRAHSLLPKAKLIAILHDPIKRAYSWYQHMRAHNDLTALNYKFSQVIRASPRTTDKKLLVLRDHCLSPGRYHIHLSKWLKYYSYRQLYLVDGGELVDNPATVMDRLQVFLHVDKMMNYSKILSYSTKKGFHCVSVHRKFHCLGASKGRHYPPMETDDIAFLEEFYRRDNLLLGELLKRFSFPLPTWLTVTMS